MKRCILFTLVALFLGSALWIGHAAARQITIRMAHDLPPFTAPGRSYDAFAKEVNEKAQGRIKVEVYPAKSLADQASGLEMLDSGVADACHISLSSNRPMFPNANVHALPGHGFPDTVEGNIAHTKALLSLIDTFPAVADEFRKYKLLFNCVNPGNLFASRDKVIRVPDDLKGLKAGGAGARLEFYKLCGAAGIFNVIPDAYQSLQTGVIDVTSIHWIAIGEFKIFEVAKYVLDLPIDMTALSCLMSKRTWDKIPAEDQKIMMEAAANAQLLDYRLNAEGMILGRKKFTEYGKGREIITPTAEQVQAWEEKFALVRNQWVAEREAAGVKNAKEILAHHKRFVDQAWGRQ
jgi:TRAP-type C4-dicarboxylate transport system substrate-binding protein